MNIRLWIYLIILFYAVIMKLFGLEMDALDGESKAILGLLVFNGMLFGLIIILGVIFRRWRIVKKKK
jgi:hypothetical protein